MKVPAFADIGKNASDLLMGKKSAAFQYDKNITLSLKTPEGVTSDMKAVLKGERLDSQFKVKYVKNVGKTTVTLEGDPALKQAEVTLKHPVLDGLKLSLQAGVPSKSKTPKVTAEYSQPHLTTKASMALAASPAIDVAATVGYEGLVLGGSARVSVRDSVVSKQQLAAAYFGKEFVATAHSDMSFSTIRGTYWQLLDASSSVAAEVIHDSAADNVQLVMGYSHVNPDTGTLHKLKLSSDAAVQLHRQAQLRPDTLLGVSVLFNAVALGSDPKIGFHIDHNP